MRGARVQIPAHLISFGMATVEEPATRVGLAGAKVTGRRKDTNQPCVMDIGSITVNYCFDLSKFSSALSKVLSLFRHVGPWPVWRLIALLIGKPQRRQRAL